MMFSTAARYWRQAMSQSAVWSAAVWTLVFTLLLTLVMTMLGAGTMVSALFHPTTPFTALSPTVFNPAHIMGGILAMFVLVIAAGPLLTAGIYGLFGQAVVGNPITWESFWRLGRQFYGRAWGLSESLSRGRQRSLWLHATWHGRRVTPSRVGLRSDALSLLMWCGTGLSSEPCRG